MHILGLPCQVGVRLLHVVMPLVACCPSVLLTAAGCHLVWLHVLPMAWLLPASIVYLCLPALPPSIHPARRRHLPSRRHSPAAAHWFR